MFLRSASACSFTFLLFSEVTDSKNEVSDSLMLIASISKKAALVLASSWDQVCCNHSLASVGSFSLVCLKVVLLWSGVPVSQSCSVVCFCEKFHSSLKPLNHSPLFPQQAATSVCKLFV